MMFLMTGSALFVEPAKISSRRNRHPKERLWERLATFERVVAGIAREIENSPMIIGGFARQLIQKISDPKNHEKLSIIVMEISQLKSLLRELGDFCLFNHWGEGMGLNEKVERSET